MLFNQSTDLWVIVDAEDPDKVFAAAMEDTADPEVLILSSHNGAHIG
jgi:hypothetical protein